MDISSALHILELDNVSAKDLTDEYVKKQYRKIALKLHPDKNGNTPESTKRFQELVCAYDIIQNMVTDKSPETGDDMFYSSEGSYFDILKQFVKSTMQGSYDDNLVDKIREIVMNCQVVSVSLFENMDRDTSLTLYQFLCTYKQVLYINDDVLNNIKDIIQQKFDQLEIYTIEPSISDLLMDHVYKLDISGEVFLVPLWHKEMYFDTKGGECEIMVMCNPNLPDGCNIDDHNNLTLECNIPFDISILNKEYIDITGFGLKTPVQIPVQHLKFRKKQLVCLHKQGMLKINEKTIYDNGTRADLLIWLQFT